MAEGDTVHPQPEGSGELVPMEAGRPLLRLADHDAIQRSFRSLARAQDGLLRYLEEAERRRRRAATWLLSGVGLLALAAGAGLGLLGRAWLAAPPPAPQVVVQPAPVEVAIPPGTAGPEVVAALRDEIEALRASREQDRQALGALTERLLERESTTLAALKTVEAHLAAPAPPSGPAPAAAGSAAGDGGPAATPGAAEVGGATPPAEPEPPEDPWLAVLNDLLGLDGYGSLRFREARRVPGEAELRDVVLLEWNEQGLLDGLIKARRARFDLQRMSSTLTVILEDGHRTRRGLRSPLPEEGERLTLPGVTVEAWLEHFPELAGTGAGAPPPPSPPAELERVRASLDKLLAMKASYGYYRLAALGGIEGTRLRLVQVQHFDNSGLLLRTYDADSMTVRLHGDGTVELLLEHGAFVEGGLRRPFYRDRFRLYLPRQPLQDWRGAGLPLVEADAE